MFKSLFIFTLLLITKLTHAQCLSSNPKNYKLEWKAFKTARKSAVEGEFQKIIPTNIKPNLKFDSQLKDIDFEIITKSIFSSNESRDDNLKSHFFDFEKIVATIKKVEKEYIIMSVLINKTTKTVPLKYDSQNLKLSASGFIDILDFKLSKQLSMLNKQCFSLHEGKTWSDVELSLSVELQECNK